MWQLSLNKTVEYFFEVAAIGHQDVMRFALLPSANGHRFTSICKHSASSRSLWRDRITAICECWETRRMTIFSVIWEQSLVKIGENY